MNYDPKTVRIRRAIASYFRENEVVREDQLSGHLTDKVSEKTQCRPMEIRAVVDRMRWNYGEISNVEGRFDLFRLTSRFDPDRKEPLTLKRVVFKIGDGDGREINAPIYVMSEDEPSAIVKTRIALEWLVNNFDDIKTSTDKNMGCDFDAD